MKLYTYGISLACLPIYALCMATGLPMGLKIIGTMALQQL